MPNILRVTVDGADELLNQGAYGAGAVIRVQTATTEAGAYADVTGTGSTPTLALVSGTRLYMGYDPAGTSASWYRVRYENSGATRLSDWGTAFQAGGEDAGLICSLSDVTERLFGSATVSTGEQETLLGIIAEVGSALEHATGRWLRPRPSSGTTTYRMHTAYGSILRIPQGIRSITTLGIATSDQPETGGTYTTQTAATYYLDPPAIERDADWPATSVRFIWAGPVFYGASYGAEITGAFGFAAVPADIRGVAIEAVTRKYIGKETAAPAIAVGPSGGVRLLASLSPDARAIVESYRVRPV
jgi:hypothetical protein